MLCRFTVVLLVIIVVCAILATIFQVQKSEHYVDNNGAAQQTVDVTLLQAKSQAYLPFLGNFVYTGSATAYNSFTSDQLQQMMQFLPTYADSLCSWNANINTNCSNFFINNIAYADNYNFESPIVCNSIETNVSLDKEQTMMRFLNNLYTLRKKCIRMNTAKQSTFAYNSGAGDTANISSVTASSGDNYMIKLNGNIDLLALMRPNMISFGNYGLYHIEPLESGADNMYTNYSSEASSHTLVLSSLKYPTNIQTNIKIYPDNINNAMNNLANNSNWNILSTVYYMNYESPSFPLISNRYYNTLSFVVDYNQINSIVANNSPAPPNYTETISLINDTTDLVDLTNIISSVNVMINLTESPNFMTLTFQTSTTTKQIVNVHTDFSNRLNGYLQQNPPNLYNNPKLFYHIVVTCTLDMVIVVAMLRDLDTNQTYFYMTQTSLNSANSPNYIQFQGDANGHVNVASTSTAPQKILNNHYKYFDAACPMTSVPNFSILAKNLGYNI